MWQDDLGHVARWLKRTTDRQENELEQFLEAVCLCHPLPGAERTGAIYVDSPGFADTIALRSYRASRAALDAEVLLHITDKGLGQSAEDKKYLQRFWKVPCIAVPTHSRKRLRILPALGFLGLDFLPPLRRPNL